ncbi:MAG: NADH-quinone oxidoreductase subunit A [Gammaproteobacteria bacterium]
MSYSAEQWPLGVYLLLCIGLIAGLLVLSHFLGQRHSEHATNDVFESGIVPVGFARFRLSAKFYLIAMFFVIFDLEAVFIFAWAVAFRESGWAGYIEVSVFMVILLAALGYLWRVGALDWGSKTFATNKKRHT